MKTAVITGASSGLGREFVRQFYSVFPEIERVWLIARRTDRLQELAEQLEEKGISTLALPLDLCDTMSFTAYQEHLVEEQPEIALLVNNAGITKDGLMMRMTEAQWDAVLTVNLKSAFNFIHATVPVMARQKSGSIINMSSVVGVSGNAGQCNYSASKAGMIGLAKSIAKEMGPRGIRANCIAPGFIITDMTNQLSDEIKEAWCKQIPLRRGGTPEDVAKVALFLASDLSSYVSGQVIHCCGAMNC